MIPPPGYRGGATVDAPLSAAVMNAWWERIPTMQAAFIAHVMHDVADAFRTAYGGLSQGVG